MPPSQDQETGINWLRGEELMFFSTSDSTVKTRLKQAGYEPFEKSGGYNNYKIPVTKLTIRSAKRKKEQKPRNLTAGQRQAIGRRLAEGKRAKRLEG